MNTFSLNCMYVCLGESFPSYDVKSFLLVLKMGCDTEYFIQFPSGHY